MGVCGVVLNAKMKVDPAMFMKTKKSRCQVSDVSGWEFGVSEYKNEG
jgi:hypothetical protein